MRNVIFYTAGHKLFTHSIRKLKQIKNFACTSVMKSEKTNRNYCFEGTKDIPF